MEVYVLVTCKKSAGEKVGAIMALAFCALLIGLSFIAPVMLFPAVVAGLIWYLLQFRSFKEYEYSYFDGELRFAKILNRSRRKNLKTYYADSMIALAPEGDPSVANYVRDNYSKKIDLSSGDVNAKRYQVVLKDEEDGTVVITYEPDEKYLEALRGKYGRKMVL